MILTLIIEMIRPENYNLRASVTVWLTCLFRFDLAALFLRWISIGFTCLVEFKPVKQEVCHTMILPPMVSVLWSDFMALAVVIRFASKRLVFLISMGENWVAKYASSMLNLIINKPIMVYWYTASTMLYCYLGSVVTWGSWWSIKAFRVEMKDIPIQGTL